MDVYTTASIVMLDIQTEETTDVLMDVMVAIVTFLVFLDKNRVVWSVKKTFCSRDCFAKHKAMISKQHKSICQLVYNCGKCNFRIVGNKKNHVCPGQRKCRNCKEIVGPNH